MTPARRPLRLAVRAAVLVLLGWAGWTAWGWARIARADVARMDAWADARVVAYRAVPSLSDDEAARLRRSLNAAHVRLGEELGVEPVAMPESLEVVAARRGLVRIGTDSAKVVWAGGYSAPYLTPDAAAALDSIAAAFRRRTDRAGLPAFRFTVSSVWRSTADQAALRRVNANAARGRSSHEFATTFDLPYRRFSFGGLGPAAPSPSPAVPRFLRPLVAEAMAVRAAPRFDALARDEPEALAALLGRALIALEDRGDLVALIERQQPVYHVTVARRPGGQAG